MAKEGTWAKIYRGMENFSPTETSASFRLKKMYTKYLSAYEVAFFHFGEPNVHHNKDRHTDIQTRIIPKQYSQAQDQPVIAAIILDNTALVMSRMSTPQRF